MIAHNAAAAPATTMLFAPPPLPHLRTQPVIATTACHCLVNLTTFYQNERLSIKSTLPAADMAAIFPSGLKRHIPRSTFRRLR
ncbi:hypothetical protein FO488_12860 [Geobacter sp. FeAm09]|uniref:hypothetical protein n=1 Tax=Geobacter sp. FeAm09 TaxID=2597769 RepID=UPI0011EFE4AB|nr:hypothetical protein [Geobacter sp. FeAm09]QEM68959.1 hypothetical protein FO488_12860 [Geobacter sp. FeAm09]